ncbi:hypothetical protein BKD09_34345 [Bradyrhizobium japonicum]|uniref:Uncharacterized protein n=1 Tax=Bradyrhizobium japonicum TaxID=375 RepID=A0A1L3FJF5_BRAJP|nr:hypothetical protein BKD09_34345 [Bradyrhizobium japonicum]OSJ33328.1 hypothetical protein BSZ19_15880 [Bradyrhizobium japonicum]
MILRKSAVAAAAILPGNRSISDAREDVMSNASNALLWAALYFALSFAAIFVVWFADKMRTNFLGK